MFEAFQRCKKYINVCDDACWKAGQMFLPSSSSLLLQANVLTISCVCTHRIFCLLHPGLDSSFRRAVCRVNWSRGLLNWFSNRILWKFTIFFSLLFLRSQLIRFNGKKRNFYNGIKHLRLFFSLVVFSRTSFLRSSFFIVSVWAWNWISLFLRTRARLSMYINGIMDLLTVSRVVLVVATKNKKKIQHLFINRCATRSMTN